MRSAGLACVVLLSALRITAAPQPGEVRIRSAPYQPPPPTIAVETNLVELGVTVRDRKGAPLGGLQASDFLLFDNLKPQSIAFFSEERSGGEAVAPLRSSAPTSTAAGPHAVPQAAPQPRYIALFFDDTHAGIAGFERSKQAAKKLIAGGLHAGDHIGIFTASGAATQDFTSDTEALRRTLGGMRRRPDRGTDRFGFGVCPTLTPYQAYVIARHLDPSAKALATAEIMGCEMGTPEDLAEQEAQSAADTAWEHLQQQSSVALDALMAVVRHLAGAPGTRILLMVSPGFPTGGMERQTDRIADACLRSHIVINALDDEGLLSSGPELAESLGQPTGPRAAWAARTLGLRTQIITGFMAAATASTGGEFIHNSNDLAGGMQSLAAAPAVSYLLGFSPPDKADGKYHKLKVTLKNSSDYRVISRPGYFAATPKEEPETAQQRIDRAVASNAPLDQVPAKVALHSTPEKAGRYRIRVDITLDAKRLPFQSMKGASVQELTFVTVLQDAAGNYLQGKEAVMDMALSNATRADLEARGIKAATYFFAPKGSYHVREVIREAIHNQFFASNYVIDVR